MTMKFSKRAYAKSVEMFLRGSCSFLNISSVFLCISFFFFFCCFTAASISFVSPVLFGRTFNNLSWNSWPKPFSYTGACKKKQSSDWSVSRSFFREDSSLPALLNSLAVTLHLRQPSITAVKRVRNPRAHRCCFRLPSDWGGGLFSSIWQSSCLQETCDRLAQTKLRSTRQVFDNAKYAFFFFQILSLLCEAGTRISKRQRLLLGCPFWAICCAAFCSALNCEAAMLSLTWINVYSCLSSSL